MEAHKITKFRRFRKVYIEIPRKNTKSTLSGAIGLYMLANDGEKGAEIYSAAADRGQAGIIHDIAKQMVRNNKILESKLQVYRNSILYESATYHNFYMAISSDAKTKHGFNAHGIIFDELHTQPNRELYDVLITSVGSRRQPLTLMLTTAGHDKFSICWEMHQYADKVAKGILVDYSFYGVIYTAPPEADIFDPKTWELANPGYPSTPNHDYLLEQSNLVKNNPSFEPTFRRLHLNQWVGSEHTWIPDDVWMQCAQEISIDDFAGYECWGGLDLGSTSDVTVIVFLFHKAGKLYLFPFFWVPESCVDERIQRGDYNYDLWIREGHMKKTPGNVTDYNYIQDDIIEICKKYQVNIIGFDPWNSSQVVISLTEAEINMDRYDQGIKNMNRPTKELERLVMSQGIIHNGNPMLRWMLSNVIIYRDNNDNLKVNKGKSGDKVDGVVATIMALGEFLTDHTDPSVYEDREMIVL
jgi:phage terminase large subunit-like protein